MKTEHTFDLESSWSTTLLGQPTLRLVPAPWTTPQTPVVEAPLRVVTGYERFVKPVLDRVLAALLLLVALPVMALTAVAIWVKLGSPVLLRQYRVGLGGEPFGMLKFRTMHHCRRRDHQPLDGPDRRQNHKSDCDPRHTPLGRFLRAWSLDELPQLINVVRGDMSLVGPRPELVDIVNRYEPWQHRRHAVRPGLTGLWQVTERATAGKMHEHVDTDLRYVERVTFSQDLAILVRTVPVLLGLQRGV